MVISTKFVSASIDIQAASPIVWRIITSPEFSKTLGNQFDEGSYVESDWKLGSKVYFKYQHKPSKPVNTGAITRLIEEKLIQVNYRFFLFWKYVEKYSMCHSAGVTQLKIDAGPYGSDLEEQKIVWGKWLAKVKEISEAES